jgi:hypothetical protein
MRCHIPEEDTLQVPRTLSKITTTPAQAFGVGLLIQYTAFQSMSCGPQGALEKCADNKDLELLLVLKSRTKLRT